MSWLTDLFKPQPRHDTPMTIELAPADPTIPAPEQTAIPDPVTTIIEPMHPRLHTADPLSAEELERHLLGQSNARLQGIALRVAAARARLADLTSAAEALSMAIDAAHYTGCDPEQWLQVELAEVLAQIEQAEVGSKRADARRVARSNRVTPLIVAVANMHTTLLRERDLLRERAYLLRKGPGISNSPIQKLREAGLNEEQIASLGQLDPGAKTLAKYGARLAEIEPVIAALDRWHASGKREHHHLDGLGFDSLIAAAQPVGEEVAP